MKWDLKDVQSTLPEKRIAIKKVGIRGLKWQLKVMDPFKGYQHTVAEVELSVDLPADQRGVHMSRFIEALQEIDSITPKGIHRALKNLAYRLGASSSYLKIRFPYFIEKESPVTKRKAPLPITGIIEARFPTPRRYLTVGVEVPVTTLCPCSKEISDRGAHNQRSLVRITVRTEKLIWFEELVSLAEESASSPVFTLLKRPDEKWVTERAYDNPKFVEDLVREIAQRLDSDERVMYYKVEAESFESIHAHQAFACIEKSSEGEGVS